MRIRKRFLVFDKGTGAGRYFAVSGGVAKAVAASPIDSPNRYVGESLD